MSFGRNLLWTLGGAAIGVSVVAGVGAYQGEVTVHHVLVGAIIGGVVGFWFRDKALWQYGLLDWLYHWVRRLFTSGG